MKGWLAAAGVLAAVAGLLLGGWLLFAADDKAAAGAASGPAPTTRLERSPDYSTGAHPPEQFPALPAEQVDDERSHLPARLRTGGGGRQLMIPLLDSDCAGQSARLLGEYDDRVEVEVRFVAKPPPPGTTVTADGSYGCVSFGPSDNPYAVITLTRPIATRRIVLSHEPF